MHLIKKQQEIANAHFDSTVFVEGVAGTGKTIAAIERIKSLIKSGVSADSILVLTPQATLALPYRTALRRSRVKTAADVHTETLGSLAFRMVDLFWPLLPKELNLRGRPHFLKLEMVQYYMTRLVEPEIRRQDYFNSVHISRNRLYTQIVDNLNKAALVGFPYDQIGERLKSAWQGDVEQAYIYDYAQASASLFREMCLKYNMFDFSLQVGLFVDYLWQQKPVRAYMTKKYRHLIVENVEEDTPATHDLLRDWLPVCDSAVLLYDKDGGFRRFLGADRDNALLLKDICSERVELDRGRVMSPDVEAFQIAIAPHLGEKDGATPPKNGDPRAAIVYSQDTRYQPQMIDWAVEHIASLVHDQGVSPREIVVLSAFLPDALRFSLQSRLDERQVPSRTHRPSRALREEPAARALLTLARLAHPDWGMKPSKYDVTYALTAAIADLDLVRARLLTDILYRDGRLLPFERISEAQMQSRVTFDLGKRYDILRAWLDTYISTLALPLDASFSKLFGEVLSQPKFGFHKRFDAANAAANLIDSAREFRQAVGEIEPDVPAAPEYVRMVDAGVIANLYIRDWEADKQDAVLIAPAYTFLLYNQPIDYQFWLNIGSSGWGQRLNQPLTQPYVMSRQWTLGDKWTDKLAVEADQKTLARLVAGLIRRCRKGIYLGYSEYGEQGLEQRGPLLMAVQNMLRRLVREERHV
ncbi:MAG: UvrD-helicase domain-containing protein [Anaerolineae bacterium]|nr:UvrD-helicase domain-containing protein [Anaerolineae bacterium]